MSTQQSTLDGAEATRVECEYYEGCNAPAMYEVEAFVYDGHGWAYEDRIACESCMEEHTETRVGGPEVRRLKPEERWSR